MRWSTHAVRSAVIASAALVIAPAARAQALLGPTRSYAIGGCASGIVGVDPSTHQYTYGTVVCASGNGVLGYTQLSGFTLLTLQLDLALTPGPFLPPSSTLLPQGATASITYTGGCTVGTVCTGLASNFGQQTQFQFFPPVPAPGSVDLASVNFTQLRLYIDYGLLNQGTTSTALDVQLSAVPEPTTLALTLGGLATVAAVVRRRERASA